MRRVQRWYPLDEGDPNDPTRQPEIYDSTYNYLLQMGFEEI